MNISTGGISDGDMRQGIGASNLFGNTCTGLFGSCDITLTCLDLDNSHPRIVFVSGQRLQFRGLHRTSLVTNFLLGSKDVEKSTPLYSVISYVCRVVTRVTQEG